MHHFTYRGGALHAEDVDLRDVAASVGTPFYCYSTATLERHYRVLSEAFADTDALVCYAMKANSNQAVLRTLARLGAGMDIVSEGELRRALAAGVPGERIVFSGVGKTRDEMALGLDSGILCFNVESEPELEALSEVALVEGHAGTRLDPHQPGRGREDPQEDLDRQVREQVRHPDRAARGRPMRRRGGAPGDPGHGRRHAYRQPDHRPRALTTMPRPCWPSLPAT